MVSGRLQLVTHHPHELGAQPLQLLERRHILQRHDKRFDRARLRVDGRGVEQRLEAAAAGSLQFDLFEAYGFAGAEHLRQGELAEGDLASVGAAADYHLKEILQRAVGCLQDAGDSFRLSVQRHRDTGLGVEYDDGDRRGVDQGFKVLPGPLLVAVAAGVGDDERGLGGKHDQGLFIFGREVVFCVCLAQKDVADAFAAVADGGGQKGFWESCPAGQAGFGKAQ